MRIYVASSWRNRYQPGVVNALRQDGNEVYDFRNPGGNNKGFSWDEIDVDWKNWTPEKFARSLQHPSAILGFNLDMINIQLCDMCVLVLPCGRSAHLELGVAIGMKKKTCVYIPEMNEPELMIMSGKCLFFDSDDKKVNGLESMRNYIKEMNRQGIKDGDLTLCVDGIYRYRNYTK